jgi:protein ImuB
VLWAERHQVMRVVAVTPEAARRGLAAGMMVSEARARQPEVLVEPLDLAGEHADRRALARHLRRFSDRVELVDEAPDTLQLEVARTAHLFGGEVGLVTEVVRALERLGHVARAVIADHPEAARALARYTDGGVVPPGEGASALASLPIVALRPTPATAAAWAALGLRTVGQLAALDKASVTGRYGAEGARLAEVARGEPARRPVEPGVEPDLPLVRVTLGGPSSTLEPILFPVRGAAADLAERVGERGRAIVRLSLGLVLEWGVPIERTIRFGRPSRRPDVIVTAIAEKLKTLRLPAPVVELWLRAEEVAPEGATQLHLGDRRVPVEPLPELLARLANTLGEECLMVPEIRPTWRPELGWRPRQATGLVERSGHLEEGFDLSDPVERLDVAERALPRPRPTLLLPEPIRVRVRTDPKGIPIEVHQGERTWRVAQAEGPERLEGHGTTLEDAWARDYWVVSVIDLKPSGGSADGERAVPEGSGWMYHEHGVWYWHGWFD